MSIVLHFPIYSEGVFEMHFTGRTWRPPYEAYSVIIQATSGCTYNKCRFCSLYHGECFRMSPLSEFEADLAEIKKYQPLHDVFFGPVQIRLI